MSVNRYNSTTGELERIAGGTLYADAPIGSIQAYGGTTAPSGWLLCQGQLLKVEDYPELYAVIGTNFDRNNTIQAGKFRVPDARECVLVGYSQNNTYSAIANHDTYQLGQFKDDQFQQWTATFDNINNVSNCTGIASFQQNNSEEPKESQNSGGKITLNPSKTARTGTTTHGKQLGVNYIIKAKQVSVPFDVAEYIRNQNVLSDYESITLPTTAATAMTMPYDGVYILANYGVSFVHDIYLNGNKISVGITGNESTGASTSSTILFKKGDTMYRSLSSYAQSSLSEHVAYYKLRDYTGR